MAKKHSHEDEHNPEHDHEHSHEGHAHEHGENSKEQSMFEMQMLQQQMQQIQQYIQTFDHQLAEIRHVIDSLKSFGTAKKGDLIFAPIANGIFIKAKLEDNTAVRINVGNNVVVEKTISDAVAMLERQEAEISQYRSEALVKMEEFMKHVEQFR